MEKENGDLLIFQEYVVDLSETILKCKRTLKCCKDLYSYVNKYWRQFLIPIGLKNCHKVVNGEILVWQKFHYASYCTLSRE